MSESRDVTTDLLSLPALDAKVIIFDVDHTITRKSTGIRFARVGLGTKQVSIFTIMSFPFYFLRYRFGNYDVANLPKVIDPLVGLSAAALDEWGRATFDKHIENDVYPEALALVRHLHAQGKKVLLSTSSADFIIKPLAQFLQVDGVVATECIIGDDGVCTGVIKGSFAFGEGKVQKTAEYLAAQGLSFDDAAFFSDSINDLPLMLKVKFPVPTNPDSRLKKRAAELGWNWISFKKK